ncbi:MAG: hypothetical protein ACI92I_000146 [Acidimicrobiales bacterium]|jgi:hypothetical protein
MWNFTILSVFAAVLVYLRVVTHHEKVMQHPPLQYLHATITKRLWMLVKDDGRLRRSIVGLVLSLSFAVNSALQAT